MLFEKTQATSHAVRLPQVGMENMAKTASRCLGIMEGPISQTFHRLYRT
jgi:hypothetical protein